MPESGDHLFPRGEIGITQAAPTRCAEPARGELDVASLDERSSTQLLQPAASGAQGAGRRFAVSGLP